MARAALSLRLVTSQARHAGGRGSQPGQSAGWFMGQMVCLSHKSAVTGGSQGAREQKARPGTGLQQRVLERSLT